MLSLGIESGDEVEIGGINFPITCPEHNAPFTSEVLYALPRDVAALILTMYVGRRINYGPSEE